MRMRVLERLRQWARAVKRDVLVLYLAARDPRVPWYAKVVAACVVAYALSPIDLIPDFIPVLGYLDDVIIVPLGIILAMRLIPPLAARRTSPHSHRAQPTAPYELCRSSHYPDYLVRSRRCVSFLVH